MTDPQASNRYNHPAYSRYRTSLRQLVQPSMNPAQATAFANAVKAYVRGIDLKADQLTIS